MRRALSAAALSLGLVASIATSGPPANIPSAHAVVEDVALSPDSPDLELLLSISTRGAVRPSEAAEIEVGTDYLWNSGSESVQIELYELTGPLEGEGLPEDALLLGTTSIRGAIGDVPGAAVDSIWGDLSHPGEEVHLLLHLVGDGDVAGDLDITVFGPDLGQDAQGSITLEVSP